MLSACATTSGNTSAPTTATVPTTYKKGCVDPALQVGARSKVNAIGLAAAYGKCKRLERDAVEWMECYLADLAGRKPTATCRKLLGG